MKPVKRPRKALGSKPLYNTVELADAAGISQYRLVRLLKTHSVFFYQIGKSFFVPQSEIQEKLQPLWASLLSDERSRKKVD